MSPYGINARDGARVTTNDAYLEPARERANLRVLGAALVDKVLVEAGRATGVRARIGGEWVDVRAQGVVLCAGAIHSPAILLRSGIGPEGPIAHLPVGEGMQEHPLALFWLFHRPERGARARRPPDELLLRYSSGLEGAGENDMMIGDVNQTLALPDDATSHLVVDDATGTWGGAGGRQGRRRSRPPVRLGQPGVLARPAAARLARPRRPAADRPGAARRGADLVRMRDGVKRALELLRTGSFDAAFEHVAIDATGRGVEALSDDAAIDRWLMETVGDTGHICGTCRMGAPDDPSTVVDPQGRVLGVEGLWVADASVFPEVPRANTNLPTIAAAERLSDLIRDAAAPPDRIGAESVPTPAGS